MQLRLIFPLAMASLLASNIWSAEPARETVASDPVAAELEELATEYQKIARERDRAVPPDGAELSDQDLSDEQWLKQIREKDARIPDPDDVMLPRFLSLAIAHPESPCAFDALAFVVRRGGPQTGDVLGKSWQLKERALDEVAKHQMDDPRIVHLLDSLSGSLPSPKTEAFFRQSYEHHPQATVRAAAGLNLAKYLNTTRQCLNRSARIEAKPRPLNNERFWKIVVIPYLKGFRYDKDRLSAEITRVLADVVDQYSAVNATDWKLTGTGRVFLQTEDFSQPTTYGDLAKRLQFELSNIVPGKQAPDIAGADAEGKPFQLSDYRGKVVLLTFSADWCGGCVELYPLERKLVEKYRDEPFVLLSVCRDESVETLKAASAQGKITWRCWWDGIEGPIYRDWNSPGAPTLFLLDHEGVIQDVHLNRFTPQDEFEQVIGALLKKVSRS